MKPKVSIIVPNYNHEKYLKQRLDSVFNQTYSNFEVILLDDASTDNSREILSQYAKHTKVRHCVFNETNSGNTFAQWNKGIALSKGDYIWIAESDDFCETHFLEKLIEPLINDSSIALVYCQSHRVNNNGKVTGNWITHTAGFKDHPFQNDFVMDGNVFIERYLIHKNVMPNVGAVLINKTYLHNITPLVFKPFMAYNADWFYYTQLICNAKVAFIASSFNYFRYHENSVIAKADDQRGRLKLYKMELQMKAFMFQFLKSKTPENLEIMRTQYTLAKNKLKYEIAQVYIENKCYLKSILSVLNNASLLKKVILTIYKKA